MRRKRVRSKGILILFRVIAFLFLLAGFFFAKDDKEVLPEKKEILRFAVLGDNHSDQEKLRQALEAAKENRAKFIIHVGDLVYNGKPVEFKTMKKVLDESMLDYYIIPGNHELGFSLERGKPGDTIFKETFGESYQAFVWLNGKIVAVNSLPVKVNGWLSWLLNRSSWSLKQQEIFFFLLNNADESQKMDNFQINWLEKSLNSRFLENELSFVFLHIPPVSPAFPYTCPYLAITESKAVVRQREMLLEILCQAKIKALFAGHLVKSDFYDTYCLNYHRISVNVSSGLLGQSDPAHFLLVKVFNDQNWEKEIVEISIDK